MKKIIKRNKRYFSYVFSNYLILCRCFSRLMGEYYVRKESIYDKGVLSNKDIRGYWWKSSPW